MNIQFIKVVVDIESCIWYIFVVSQNLYYLVQCYMKYGSRGVRGRIGKGRENICSFIFFFAGRANRRNNV